MTTSEVVFGPITELQACQAAHDRLRKINAELCRTANSMNRHGADLRTRLDAAEQAAWALEHANPERNQVLRALHGQVAELTTQLATEREEFESVLIASGQNANRLEVQVRELEAQVRALKAAG